MKKLLLLFVILTCARPVKAENPNSGSTQYEIVASDGKTLRIEKSGGRTWRLISTTIDGVELLWWQEVMEYKEIKEALAYSKKNKIATNQ